MTDPRRRRNSSSSNNNNNPLRHPHWVPPPGKATRRPEEEEAAKGRSRSFPLCLVCDRANVPGGEEAAEEERDRRAEAVARRCEAEAGAEAEGGEAGLQDYYDYRRGERQRLKVREGRGRKVVALLLLTMLLFCCCCCR